MSEGHAKEVPKLSLSGKTKVNPSESKEPTSKHDMLRKISPRHAPQTSPSSGPSGAKSPPPSSPASEKKRVFAFFGSKKEQQEAPTSIPTTTGLQRTSSSSLAANKNGVRSPPVTPGSSGAADELVWAQVTTATDETDAAALAAGTRKRGSTKGSRKSSNADSESEDSSAGNVMPLTLKRGQMVLLLDGGSAKQSLAFCGGVLGRVDRSHVKLLDGTSAPQCPVGDTAEDGRSLRAAFCWDDFRLVQLMLDCLPNAAGNTLATFLIELLKYKETDSRALLQLLIRQEVKNTSEHQMLFRGNTVASKVLSQFAREVGQKYLDVLLRPLIRSTVMMAHEIVDFLEFNPASKSPRSPGRTHARRSSDAAEDEDMDMADFLRGSVSDEEVRETSSEELARKEKNEQTAVSVWESTEMVLAVLYESFAKVPPALRHCAYDMKTITEPKFADYHLVLAGFFILRFIAPAIAAPLSFRLDCMRGVELTAEAKKRLLQVSKVIQAVANNVLFKESSHLDVLNEHVTRANQRLRAFFDCFVQKDAAAVAPDNGWKHAPDPHVMTSFWRFCIENVAVVARRAAATEDPADARSFSALIDCLSGLPMSNNLKGAGPRRADGSSAAALPRGVLLQMAGQEQAGPEAFTVPRWHWNPRCYGLFDQYWAMTAAQRGIMFSFGASAVLLYAVPESPLSQPRNIVGGNILGSVIGMLCRYITLVNPDLRWLADSLAVSCSIVAMQLTLTVHPPTGATALVASTTVDLLVSPAWWFVLMPVVAGSCFMVLLAVIFDNFFADYPHYWL